MVEPNVKEGSGGLRDLQTLYWLSRYVFNTFAMSELVGKDAPGGGILTQTEARGLQARLGISSGPCASTCITSPAARRSV